MIREFFGFRVTEPLSEPNPQVSRQFDLRRIYSALVFVPLFYLLVRYGPPILFSFLVTAVSLLALWEFYGMSFPTQGHRISMIVGVGLLLLILLPIQYLEKTGIIFILTVVIFGALIFLMMNFTPGKQVIPTHLIFPFGALYIGVGLGHFLLIRNLAEGDLFVFFVILVTWAADTAAYYTGKTMGRRPLAPRLSPKKTVEGFVGGLLCAMFVAGLSHFWFFPFLSLGECVIIGVLLTGLGLLGDLAESYFKRSSGVKDSGTLIPGHGGVLDRLDSLLFTGPAFYYSYIFLTGAAGGI
ncbi:MAG: phosphatidate cytidylyltransferase [Nitrospirota bacterium]|nr:MAG: phosphatidate cytidylyltransferase [Nitrospirota bacterium]